jgi:hypothetical protein
MGQAWDGAENVDAAAIGRRVEEDGIVSLQAKVPEPLLRAMRDFIEQHPNWDQYRLFQAALAGFLVQNSVRDREITRCYLANLFPGSGRFQNALPPRRQPIPLRVVASQKLGEASSQAA